MNCRQFDEQFVELFESKRDPVMAAELYEHAINCADCRAVFDEVQSSLSTLKVTNKIQPPLDLKKKIILDLVPPVTEPVEESLPVEARPEIRLRLPRLRWWWALLPVALIAAVTGFFIWKEIKFNTPIGMLAETVAFMSELKSLHYNAMMRTSAKEAFELDLRQNLIPVEIWKRFGSNVEIRVSKVRRDLFVNGTHIGMLIKPESGPVFAIDNNNTYKKVTKIDNVAQQLGWLVPLLEPRELFLRELEDVKKNNSKAVISKVQDKEKKNKLILTIETTAMPNKSESRLFAAGNARIYVFDAKSHRLESMQITKKTGKKDIVVFETTAVNFNETVADETLRMNLPEKAVLYHSLEEFSGTGAGSARIKPEDFARNFFYSLAAEDWAKVKVFCPLCGDAEGIRDMGGLTLVRVGKSFRAGGYTGWFVPYEVRLKDGTVKKYNLAVKNENPKKQWRVDGGI